MNLSSLIEFSPKSKCSNFPSFWITEANFLAKFKSSGWPKQSLFVASFKTFNYLNFKNSFWTSCRPSTPNQLQEISNSYKFSKLNIYLKQFTKTFYWIPLSCKFRLSIFGFLKDSMNSSRFSPMLAPINYISFKFWNLKRILFNT